MPLNSSGPLGLGGETVGQSVNLELGKAATAFITMNDTDLRSLFGVASGSISLSQGYGKSSFTTNATRGYFGGGNGYPNVGSFNNVDRMEFSTETLSSLGGQLPILYRIYTNAGVNNTSRGYALGEQTNGTEVIGIEFATETGTNPAVSMGRTKIYASAFQSTSRGYRLGGYDGSVVPAAYINDIDALQFSDETYVDTASVIPDGTLGFSGAVNTATRGYCAGGTVISTPAIVGTIRRMTFADETVSVIGATLAQARENCDGVASATRGYFGGGNVTPIGLTEIDGIDFASETGINPGAALVQARWSCKTINSAQRGYFGGGYRGPAEYNQLDGIIFASETTIDPAAGTTGFNSAFAVNNSNH